MDHSGLGSGTHGGAAGPRAVRRRRGRIPAAIALASLALLAATVSGCQPRSRYKPLAADSTAVLSADSLRAAAEAAVQRWDSGADEDAARLSAAVVLDAIRTVAPEIWADRARALLDSLSIGAEIGGAPSAMMVNFFSRADPDRGSWPWLFWATGQGPRHQSVEGRDLRFLELATRGGNAPPAAVAALFARRAAIGGTPIAYAWKPAKGGGFTLAQTLGPDSLGGAGTGEFAQADTTIELHVRTYRTQRGFTECATCPHVYAIHRFRWDAGGFVRQASQPVPSPYSTFVRFVHALQANDREAGFAELTDGSLWDQARDLDWQQPRGLWRVAPSTDETAREMVFFRGEQEAYRVHFESRVGDWKISAFETTSRTVE